MNILLLTFRLNRGAALGRSLGKLGHNIVVEAVGLPNSTILKNLWRLIASFFRLKSQFDVVITESLDYNGLLSLLLSIFDGIPFIVHLRGFYPADSLDTTSGFSRWIDNKLSIAVLSRASHISYNSRFLKTQYNEFFKTHGKESILQKPSTIIHQSIDEEYFEDYVLSDSQVKRILYVGNLNFRGKFHGVKLLLDFWRNHRLDDYIILTIVGSGRYLNELTTLVEKDEIEKVEFLGHVSKLDLIQLYTSSYIFVYPSYQDALPSVVLEAQAMGLPAIVTNTSGAREIVVDGLTGIICEPQIETLGNAVKRLLDNTHLRDEMSVEAKRHIKEIFTWDIAASQLVAILNNLVSLN